MALWIVWLDAAANAVGTVAESPGVATNPTTWATIPDFAGVAPAGAVVAQVRIGIAGSGPRAIGNTFDVRHVMIVKGATAVPYFDGSTPATSGSTYRWTGTPNASTSQKLATAPLTLTWWPDYGAVRFLCDEIPTGSTVFIIGPGEVLQSIRGYEDDTWHAPNGPGVGYSFEMPMGVIVRYGIAPMGATSWPGAGVQAAILTPQNQAWLRDLYDPTMSRRVAVVSTGEESRPARQSVLRVSGRAKPVVLWDVREARQGTITLAIQNDSTYPTLWQTTEKDLVDRLLDTGRPLLLSLCQSKDFPPCYMAVTDSTYARVGSKAQWLLQLTYVEIDNPVDVPVMIPAEVTYEDRMVGDPTYQTWLNTFPDYLAVATEEV
jgi:hypothetical protein